MGVTTVVTTSSTTIVAWESSNLARMGMNHQSRKRARGTIVDDNGSSSETTNFRRLDCCHYS